MPYKLELGHDRITEREGDGEERASEDETCCDRRRPGVVGERAAEVAVEGVRGEEEEESGTHCRLVYTRRPARRERTRKESIVGGDEYSMDWVL